MHKSTDDPLPDKKSTGTQKVIGRSSCMTLVECKAPFPEKYPAVAIQSAASKITGLDVQVCKNKVMVKGVLHKSVIYRTAEGAYEFTCVDESPTTVFGSLKHVSFDIPFKCSMDIQGAKAGDSFQAEFAGMEEGCELDLLKEPFTPQEWQLQVELFRELWVTAIIRVDLRVFRST